MVMSFAWRRGRGAKQEYGYRPTMNKYNIGMSSSIVKNVLFIVQIVRVRPPQSQRRCPPKSSLQAEEEDAELLISMSGRRVLVIIMRFLIRDYLKFLGDTRKFLYSSCSLLLYVFNQCSFMQL